jgi:hypothetical protein
MFHLGRFVSSLTSTRTDPNGTFCACSCSDRLSQSFETFQTFWRPPPARSVRERAERFKFKI